MEAKFVLKPKADRLSVISKTQNKVNTRELSSIKSGEFDYLITPVVVDNGKTVVAHFDIDEYISLYEYVQRGISPTIFANIGLNILETTEKIKAQVMQVGNLLLDLRYIYVNEKNLDIKYIYVPFIHAKEEPNIRQVLKNLPFYCVFDDTNNIEFVSKYIDFFNNMVNFSVLEYRQFVMQKMGSNAKAYVVLENSGEAKPIKIERFIIGKGDDVALKVDSVYVSRHHALIYQENDKYYIKDCNSKNHTYLNDKQLAPEGISQLFNGDNIRLADVKLTFALERGDNSEL